LQTEDKKDVFTSLARILVNSPSLKCCSSWCSFSEIASWI